MIATTVKPETTTVPAPVEWLESGVVRMVDQRRLPAVLEYVTCHEAGQVAEAIGSLRVRGAPAIGLAAAYGLGLVAARSTAEDVPAFLSELRESAALLRATRPTAVNLGWALDEVLSAAREAAASGSVDSVKRAVMDAARRIDAENDTATRRMGEHGAALLRDDMSVLTHCNAGPLAAGGIGSALGAIYTAHSQGKKVHVWVDETRPVLQGARLTTWELMQWGIPCTLIADSMAASLMAAGRIDAVLVGADRIAANGDAANKIGTYGLAVLAHAHGIPFYVVAPESTVDRAMPDGASIKIEERHRDEVTHHAGILISPEGVSVYNPAFDVTPNRLISCIITESGVYQPPFRLSAQD
jgi:methylthioribose-1-phosphate isomerase